VIKSWYRMLWCLIWEYSITNHMKNMHFLFENWWNDVLYHVTHHIIFVLVIMIDTPGLSPRMPSLLENPFTFFTNTCHLLQCYHLSFSTKNCIFPCNTVVNIDVAPHLPVCHIITYSE
jgi:hypothetical protein